MIQGILFDKDGTLIDFAATYAPATTRVIGHLCGGDPSLAQAMAGAVDFDLAASRFASTSIVIAGTGKEIAEAWSPFLPGFPADELAGHVDAAYEMFSVEYLKPFPGTRLALEDLAAHGFGLGIATNDTHANALIHRARLEFDHLLPFVAGYDSGFGAKPGPGMVHAFADHLGIASGQVVMVGDSPHDMMSARAAGAVAIAVTTGLATAGELAPHADHVISGIEALPALVRELSAHPAG